MSVTMYSEAKDWTAALDAARDADGLRAVCRAWAPHVPDASKVARDMTARDFRAWRRGLLKERRKRFAGAAWATRFGALLLPERLMEAGAVASRYHVPLGVALHQLERARQGERTG